MTGKFEIFKTKSDQFGFRLKASNGQVILASEGYTRKASAQDGVASVRENAVLDERYERKNNKAGQPMFNLVARNGQVIGTSEAYSSAAARDHGIGSVQSNAPDAHLEDLTDA